MALKHRLQQHYFPLPSLSTSSIILSTLPAPQASFFNPGCDCGVYYFHNHSLLTNILTENNLTIF